MIVVYKRVHKKFTKLKAWISSTQRAAASSLPDGADEDSLDASVSATVREELVSLRKAANMGKVAPETYYNKVFEMFRVNRNDYDTAMKIVKEAESGIRLFDGACARVCA